MAGHSHHHGHQHGHQHSYAVVGKAFAWGIGLNLIYVIAQGTVGFFDFALADKKLVIEIDVDDTVCILVQQDLFTQAVRNIVGNAIKFSRDGKRIYITATQNKDQILLSIRDEGLGFKPGDLERIFDRFTKAGKKGTHGENSVGLGLYLCKKIVERHGGLLTAHSDGPNKGATFTIALYKLVIKKKQAGTGRRVQPTEPPRTDYVRQ